MSANVDAMVREAIRAYRAGNKTEARTLLERATELDQNNEQAWMWLSAVVESVEDQRVCLENVLYLNPNNENAKRGLDILATQSQETPSVSSSNATTTEENDPFANASFTNTPTPSQSSSAPPPTATSSASSEFTPEEPEPEIYDEWVSGLNLGGESAEAIAESKPQEEEIVDDADFENLFSDVFTEDYDRSKKDDNDPAGDRLDDLFSDNDSSPISAGPFTSDAFGFEDDIFDEEPPTSSGISTYNTGSTKDDDFELDDLFADEDDDLDDLFNDVSPSKSSTSKKRGKMSPVEKPRSAGAFVPDGMGGSVDDVDPSEYFKAIPKNIKPTRVPGMDESYPALVIIGLLTLILLNAGAVGLLFMNISS